MKREVLYHARDNLGSRQVVIDASGNVSGGGTGDVEYRSFGSYAGGDKREYAFTGKRMSEHAEGCGFTYFNGRWYDPETGRFITADPIKDGINWYVYCGNNPLRYVDKTGLYAITLPFPITIPYPAVPITPIPPIVIVPANFLDGLNTPDYFF